MQHVVKILGRFRPVDIVSMDTVAGEATVKYISGYRHRRAKSGRHPGPGWGRIIGTSNEWEAWQPMFDETRVKTDALLADWPIGLKDNGFDESEVAAMLIPHMLSGKNANGPRAARTMPDIKIETLELKIHRAGIPMPTDDEWESIRAMTWADLQPKSRRIAPTAGITSKPPDQSTKHPTSSKKSKLQTRQTLPRMEPDTPKDPTGKDMGKDMFWSKGAKRQMKDTALNRKLDEAYQNGWPEDVLNGAKLTQKGAGGYTVNYAAKKRYDPDVHAVDGLDE